MALLSAASLATPAAAQSFNVEFRSSESALHTDGIRGYWNSLRSPDATVHELVDVDGLLTFVSMSGAGGSPVFHNLMNASYEVTTYTGAGASRWIVDVEEGLIEPDAAHTIRGIQVRLLDGRVPLFMTESELTWRAALASESYDVVSGDLTTLHATGGDFMAATTSCHAENHAVLRVDHSGTPPSGEGFWYLNRGVTEVAPLSYDAGSISQVGARDAEIERSAAACN